MILRKFTSREFLLIVLAGLFLVTVVSLIVDQRLFLDSQGSAHELVIDVRGGHFAYVEMDGWHPYIGWG